MVLFSSNSMAVIGVVSTHVLRSCSWTQGRGTFIFSSITSEQCQLKAAITGVSVVFIDYR